MSLQQYKIPRYVDSMYQFFFWEADVFFVCILVLGISFAVNHPIIGLFTAGYLSRLLSKTKNAHLDGQLAHWAFQEGYLDLNKRFKHGGKTRKYFR